MMDRGESPALVLVDCRKDGGQFEPFMFLQDLSPCQLHSHSRSREVAEPRDLGHSASIRARLLLLYAGAQGSRTPTPSGSVPHGTNK